MSNFAVLDIWWSYTCTDWILYVLTSSAVHLWTFYTGIEPRRHLITRIIRGVSMPWDTYFCFVAWKMLEQEEPGDTYLHTFIWLDWPPCLTRWYTHRGKVEGEWSPSCGPLFKKHREAVDMYPLIIEPWSLPPPGPPPPPFCPWILEPWTS